MFVDASALVAILAAEPDGRALADRVSEAKTRLTSALAVYEATLAVARLKGADLGEADAAVQRYLQTSDITVVPLDAEDAAFALDAHARFGKGRHPARLNLADCFAYACANRHRVPLLYKGDDFALTDIEAAAAG